MMHHLRNPVREPWILPAASSCLLVLVLLMAGCSAQSHRQRVDASAYETIQTAQRDVLGKTNAFTIDRAANALRQRLFADQNLLRSSPASLGSHYLEATDHWPSDNYLSQTVPYEMPAYATTTNGALILTLVDALQVAARNNRDYQSNKEDLFQAALDLDLERNVYRTTLLGLLSGGYTMDRTDLFNPGDGTPDDPGRVVTESFDQSVDFGAVQRLKSGGQISLGFGWNLFQLIRPEWVATDSMVADASITIPLLRGAGRHIETESLTQAERDVVYAIYDFDEFKQSFAVEVADNYLSVLQQLNQVQNAEENYRGLIASTRRARRLLDAGQLPPIQVDQAIQDELSARNRWVSEREGYIASLDNFKLFLGLPTDAAIALDSGDLNKLSSTVSNVLSGAAVIEYESDIPPADAPIVLEEPSNENAGPLEMAPEQAMQLALENRHDLRIAQGNIYDAQRRVVIAADALRAELTLFGGADYVFDDPSDVALDKGTYEAVLNLNLPLERTAEAVNYRRSYINLEQAVRNLQALEDGIKLDVVNRLRTLRETRESLRIQALSVELARRRVRGANLNLQAGRAEIRDLLEAQEDLLSAQNSLTAAIVDYRVAELALQRDLGLLEVDSEGMWKEYEPEQKDAS